MKYGLPDTAIQKISAVLSRCPQVDEAILYGSRAKGSYKNGSDIDLALRGGADLTLQVVYGIIEELDDLLLPYTIDLAILGDIEDPDVMDHIRRVGITFYKKGQAVSEPAAVAQAE
ncbi:MAG: nucleotidyltransferase domain-containing protein [Nitrospirae bacterium]|nr:nucleotidyltransferase domain-containing protein [Nitrospirota bacterium]